MQVQTVEQTSQELLLAMHRAYIDAVNALDLPAEVVRAIIEHWEGNGFTSADWVTVLCCGEVDLTR